MRNKKMTNRQLKALETKKALFESAMSLFKEQGFDNVYIEDIAAKAGTSKGSFYTYFKTKDDVIIEHYKKIDEQYESVFRELPATLKASEKLLKVLIAGIIFSEKYDPEILSIVLINQLNQKDAASFIMNRKRNLYKITHHLIEEGQLNGEFVSEFDSNHLTDMLLCYYKGIYLDWCLTKGEFDFVERSKNELSLFINKLIVKENKHAASD